MYLRIALISLLLWCAGCTQDSAPPASSSSHAAPGAAGVALTSGGALRATPTRRHSFANLPDRGDLVAYPAQRVVRKDGAYTWHRAGLSEEHALRAVGGVMQIITPAGERLEFQYERHVEHPSGDWTWIGRAKGGAVSDEVVLTFGEKAAFGSISQPGGAPLKLTMGGGVSWLIEVDRAQISGIDNPATRPRNPDFLVPPKLKMGSGASAASIPTPAPSITSLGAQAAAATVVDVLLGYTNGFAAAQGGQSQAVTRLNNMVEITNQAYANSQLDARIRLVHAMQVSYPDNTSNDGALEAMTGFRAPRTRTTPDAAFAALRAARDQYGADLVSLVRDFNTPENDGCGIAWLIGGGQTGIGGSDEYFGYSVVSDGRDVGSDGKTYFCREETLAHELGHNMGSQHDRVAATVDGTTNFGLYPYSFGYKPSEGSLYTVMAYGDTGQTGYRIFSNPRSVFCGVPCGIDNQADNARSLGQAMPVVSGFRATVVGTMVAGAVVSGDLNGDNKDDIVWQNDSQNEHGYWLMDGPAYATMKFFGATPGYRIIETGDFNGDGLMDELWTNDARDLWLLTGNGSGFADQFVATHGAGWEIVGAGDVNGDKKDDLIWHNQDQNLHGYWLMNGASYVGMKFFAATPGYRILAIGDFNGDGLSDELWANNDRDLWMLSSNGSSFVDKYVATHSAGWQVVGVGDVNGDGKADLIWHNPVQNEHGYWLMNGSAYTGMSFFKSTPGYRILATGDYNGDGLLDELWTSDARDLWMLTGNGRDFSDKYVASSTAGWSVVGSRVN